MNTPSTKLPIGTKVQFTDSWLAHITPAENRRYKNRPGEIVGYRAQATNETPLPIVGFEKAGRFKAERLLEVPWDRIEIVPSEQPKI